MMKENYYVVVSLAIIVYLTVNFRSRGLDKGLAVFNEDGLPIVNTHNGKIKGVNSTSFSGTAYHSFHAIPYAQPPVGQLRFALPEPVEDWEYIKDATRSGPACIQVETGNDITFGEEDCLWLSIYSPELPISSEKPLELKPVLVWIHGGRYVQGTGRDSFYSPSYIMDYGDIVVVSVQYRLGVMGWLSTEDAEIPGNFGYHDQNLALRWVQKNIHLFGGDKDQVTIMGQSAGGASVHSHMFSPLSKGLFHKVAALSGAVTAGYHGRWDIYKNTAIKQAEVVGCPTETSKEILDCLRKVDARTLTLAQSDLFTLFKRDHAKLPLTTFLPRMDPESARPFFPRDPVEMLRAGDYDTTIPYMTGVTSMEGAWYTACLMLEKNMDTFNENKMLAFNLLVNNGFLNDEKGVEKIYELYLDNEAISVDHLKEIAGLTGEAAFVYPALYAIHLHSRVSSAPVYFYVFDYRGNWTFPNLYGDYRDHGGVAHLDDLRYLFRLPWGQDFNEEELEVMRAHTGYIRHFVKTGRPTADEKEWPAYTKGKAQVMHILAKEERGVSRELPFSKKRMELWRELYQSPEDCLSDYDD